MLVKKYKPVFWGLVLALAISTIVSELHYFGVFKRLEWISYDWRMKLFNADKQAPENVVVILIDEASLQYMNSEAGRWPWPRSVHADLLDFLSLGNPRAVVFDILFVENQLREDNATSALNLHDQRLIEASAQSGFTYHATQLLSDTDTDKYKPPVERPLPELFTTRFALPTGHQHDFPAMGYTNYELPIAGLWEASAGIGVVRADADLDGVYRRVQLFHNYQGNLLPALSMAPLMKILHPKQMELHNRSLTIDQLAIPVAQDGSYLVNMYGKIKAYSYSGLLSSYRRIMSGDIEHLPVDPAEFENKIVFIGSNAVGVQDLKSTPLSSTTAGVDIHASVAGNVLTHDFLRPPTFVATVGFVLLLSVTTGLSVLTLRKVYLKVFLPVVLACAFISITIWLFKLNVVLDMITPLIALALTWAVSFTHLVTTEGKDKKKVRKMLSQYVSPAVLATVVDQYEDYLKAEVGSRNCISVLFSDIRGFTTLSETMEAEKTVDMLNTYFSAMTDAIFEYHGTIDKFIGDAIMAFWGAPIEIEDHAKRAVQTAIKMLDTLPDVNKIIQAKGFNPISIGIGINTGEVILGNIGSDKKLDYTIIGDNVNLASRLEGLTKVYKCPIILSEFTYHEIKDEIPCRVVDLVRVKGKQHPIRVYAPVLQSDAQTTNQNAAFELSNITAEAFSCYLEGDWSQALQIYQRLPNDPIREIFIQRCRRYLNDSPPKEWDGIFTLGSK
jgi:adenylate cyclase